MQKKQILQIIERFAANSHSPELRAKFKQWITSPEDAGLKEEALLEYWQSIDGVADETVFADLQELYKKIKVKESRKFSYYFVRVAAIVMLPLLCSSLTYYFTKKQAVSDIHFVEHFVENGEKEQISLPDGTEVWINSGSLLVYPQEFVGDTRLVFLTGEAYFSVSKNQKPFLVMTNHLTIEALGTAFNVRAYMDTPQTTATLEEGKIKVETKDEVPQTYILSPNEQLAYNNKTKQITLRTEDAGRVAMWKDGYLIFQGASLDEVLHGISRRYDVVAQFDSGKYTGRSFTVRFGPDDTLSETLSIIKEIIPDFDYTIKGNTIFVY